MNMFVTVVCAMCFLWAVVLLLQGAIFYAIVVALLAVLVDRLYGRGAL